MFIGAGSRILPDVKIGPNAIVAAGSLVNKDVLPGTVVGGVPARVIGSFDDLRGRRAEYTEQIRRIDESELDDYSWQHFYEERK